MLPAAKAGNSEVSKNEAADTGGNIGLVTPTTRGTTHHVAAIGTLKTN